MMGEGGLRSCKLDKYMDRSGLSCRRCKSSSDSVAGGVMRPDIMLWKDDVEASLVAEALLEKEDDSRLLLMLEG